MPQTVSPAIRWGKSDLFLDWVVEDVNWEILEKPKKKDITKEKSTFVAARGTVAGKKRKSLDNNDFQDHLSPDMPRHKKLKTGERRSSPFEVHDPTAPAGTPWRENSCAYDVTLAILHNVWRQCPVDLRGNLSDLNPQYLRSVVAGFAEGYDLLSASPTTFPRSCPP